MAADTFLKMTDFEGETTDDAHKGCMEIESWSVGHNQSSGGSTSTAGARSAGRVSMGDIHFVKKADSASPLLALRCADGTHVKEVVLSAYRATGKKEKYLEIKMNDCLISSYQLGGSGGGDVVPTDQFSLNYGRIEWIYIPTDKKTGKPAGPKMNHWDVTANKGG